MLYRYLTLFSILFSVSFGNADMDADRLLELKTNAQEKLVIEVVSFASDEKIDCKNYFLVEAKVLSDGEHQHAKYGHTIAFKTYTNSVDSGCKTTEAAPPMLEVGWCGLAFLNKDSLQHHGPLVLAARGDSLQQAPPDLCVYDLFGGAEEEEEEEEEEGSLKTSRRKRLNRGRGSSGSGRSRRLRTTEN